MENEEQKVAKSDRLWWLIVILLFAFLVIVIFLKSDLEELPLLVLGLIFVMYGIPAILIFLLVLTFFYLRKKRSEK
jgi:hypothetical protein